VCVTYCSCFQCFYNRHFFYTVIRCDVAARCPIAHRTHSSVPHPTALSQKAVSNVNVFLNYRELERLAFPAVVANCTLDPTLTTAAEGTRDAFAQGRAQSVAPYGLSGFATGFPASSILTWHPMHQRHFAHNQMRMYGLFTPVVFPPHPPQPLSQSLHQYCVNPVSTPTPTVHRVKYATSTASTPALISSYEPQHQSNNSWRNVLYGWLGGNTELIPC
jgi:hypothetical protein